MNGGDWEIVPRWTCNRHRPYRIAPRKRVSGVGHTVLLFCITQTDTARLSTLDNGKGKDLARHRVDHKFWAPEPKECTVISEK